MGSCGKIKIKIKFTQYLHVSKNDQHLQIRVLQLMLLSEVSSLEKEFLVTLYPSSLSFVKYLKLLRVAR